MRFRITLALSLAACAPEIDATLVELEVGDQTRTAYVHLPDDVANPPLLLAFHGAALTGAYRGAAFSDETGFITLADERGFAVAFPNGVEGKWSDSQREDPDDQTFVEALIDSLSEDVDTGRVVAAGHSNGGFFSTRLGCERPDLVRGVASVAGGLLASQSCPEGDPVSFLLAAGTDDDVVPISGGKVLYGFGPRARAHDEVVALLRERLTCGDEADTRTQSADDGTSAVTRTYTACTDGHELTSVRIAGGNHVWPGGDDGFLIDSKQAWPASEAIVDYAERVWSRGTEPE